MRMILKIKLLFEQKSKKYFTFYKTVSLIFWSEIALKVSYNTALNASLLTPLAYIE